MECLVHHDDKGSPSRWHKINKNTMIQIKKIQQSNPNTKEVGYSFRQVNVMKATEKDVANSLAVGGTYSVGESKGILTDFGVHLAQLLANNNKVVIDELGTFELSLKSGWAKEASDMKKSNVSLTINFTPSQTIMDIVNKAEIKVVQTATVEAEDADKPSTQPQQPSQPTPGGDLEE